MAKTSKKQAPQTTSFIKFLGTAGARFVMIRQMRACGGIWVHSRGTNLIIDPGPGALVRCCHSRPALDPCSLDGIVLTHKHLDHSNDINVMIEAMTEGGFRRRGTVFLPSDSLGPDGVVFSYCTRFPQSVVTLHPGDYSVGKISFSVPIENKHSVETYGLKLRIEDEIVSVMSDTRYFDGLIDAYRDSTIIVLNVVFYQQRSDYDHLCLDEALAIVRQIRPKKAILTHFGMGMLRAKPHELEKKIKKELPGVWLAYDGMTLTIP